MDDQEDMGMGDMGEAGAMPAESAGPDMADHSDMPSEKNTVMLSADHFPKGVKLADGAKLTFCVTGNPDSEGNVSGYFEEAGAEEPGREGENDDPGNGWADDFKRFMSPSHRPGANADAM